MKLLWLACIIASLLSGCSTTSGKRGREHFKIAGTSTTKNLESDKEFSNSVFTKLESIIPDVLKTCMSKVSKNLPREEYWEVQIDALGKPTKAIVTADKPMEEDVAKCTENKIMDTAFLASRKNQPYIIKEHFSHFISEQ